MKSDQNELVILKEQVYRFEICDIVKFQESDDLGFARFCQGWGVIDVELVHERLKLAREILLWFTENADCIVWCASNQR